MSVILTQEVEGLNVGDTYTGSNEAYLLASGYAKEPALGELQTVTKGGSDLTSFTLTHSGQTTGALSPTATAAQIQTALEGLSNLAPGDVTVTGANGGPWSVRFGGAHAALTATPTGGTGTVTVASVGDGAASGPGVSNTGPADTTVANNREFDATRGDIAVTSDLPEGATNDGIVKAPADAPNVAYAGSQHVPNYDVAFDGFANSPDSYPLEVTRLAPATGAAVGGTVVAVRGFGFTNLETVEFGGVEGTDLEIEDDKHLTVTTGAHAAGVVDVVFTRGEDVVTVDDGFTYTA